jgi:Alanine dehydrogenase/PNT, N-terminal domain
MLKLCTIYLLFVPLVWSLGVRTPLRLDKASFVSSRLHSTKESLQLVDPFEEAFDKNKKRFLGEPIPYKDLIIGVLREDTPGETRVSQTPESVATLVQKGFQVLVESGGERIIF